MPGRAEAVRWSAGDRVEVQLPDKGGLRGRVNSHNWFPGTVRDTDTGTRPGVRIDLDFPVNGLDHCYATHGELRRQADVLQTQDCPDDAPDGTCWSCSASRSERHKDGCQTQAR